MREDPELQPVLADHVKRKKKLIPPILQVFGDKYSPYSWTRQLVPEVIWIALCIEASGYERAVKLCSAFACTAGEMVGEKAPLFARMSAFNTLNADLKIALLADTPPEILDELRSSLRPLRHFGEVHPLAFLVELEKDASRSPKFDALLAELYDRNSRISALSIAVTSWIALEQGKLKLSPHLVDDMIENFRSITDYPKTDRSKRAAGSFRASAPMLLMKTPLEKEEAFQNDDEWVSTFWHKVSGFGPCMHEETVIESLNEGEDQFHRFILDYKNWVIRDLRDRLDALPLDLNKIEPYDVISGLISRQATLALEFASSPPIWNAHTAPIMLRAMADVFITLAWILKDPVDRANRFIEDGLGSIKLQIAHRERQIQLSTDEEEIENQRKMIESLKDWLTSQRLEPFVTVNLGSWSGMTTRQMAEDAGVIDFYNYVYTPFSTAVHSNWAHVSMLNCVMCQNPAHRLHRVGAIPYLEPDLHWLYLATKYFDKTIMHLDSWLGRQEAESRAYDFFVSSTTSGEKGTASEEPA
ncbi:MAG TPA: DUF5677 domain-containing protein [Caulobacteraceae bacterium]|nr:DUF5677 domain-containing protein [Caulobacteraceae bacterium]